MLSFRSYALVRATNREREREREGGGERERERERGRERETIRTILIHHFSYIIHIHLYRQIHHRERIEIKREYPDPRP